jgi:alkylhydroperoxidase family enzyme
VSDPPRIPPGSARIAPGSPRDIGRLNALIVRVLGLGTGGRPANVFTTLARHRGLFRRWLIFAGGLMPGGRLPRTDGELLILRTARNCDCEYEWLHHERIGRVAGLRPEQIDSLRLDAPPDGIWTERQRLLVRAADELHAERTLSEELWTALRTELSETEMIELCLLVGHYEMLAMTLRALHVQPDPEPMGSGSPAARLAGRRLARGGR